MPRSTQTAASKIDSGPRNPEHRAPDETRASKKNHPDSNQKETTTMKTKTKTDKLSLAYAHSAAHYEAAYRRRLPQLLALAPESVMHVTADVITVITQLHGAHKVLCELRPRVAKLPEFDMDQYDALHEYAQVLQYTHARYLSVIEAPDPLPALNDEGSKLCARLFTDMQALVERGFIPQERLDALRAGQGYRDTGEDLTASAFLLRSIWGAIEGRTAITEEEIERAHVLGSLILEALGRREQADEAAKAARDERERAFTLTARAYEQARHAAAFLQRNDGDGGALLPSLFAQKGTGRAKKIDDAEPTVEKPVAEKPAAEKPAFPVDTRPLSKRQDNPFTGPVVEE